jgi:hypothetical protein
MARGDVPAHLFAHRSSKSDRRHVYGVRNDQREGFMEVDIIITIGIVAVLLFTITQGSRIIRTGSMHKTLRKAIEQGQPLNSDLIEGLDKRAEPGTNDQRIGFVLVAAALALILAGAIQESADDFRDMATAGIFPLFVGGALLLRLWLVRRRGIES